MDDVPKTDLIRSLAYVIRVHETNLQSRPNRIFENPNVSFGFLSSLISHHSPSPLGPESRVNKTNPCSALAPATHEEPTAVDSATNQEAAAVGSDQLRATMSLLSRPGGGG